MLTSGHTNLLNDRKEAENIPLERISALSRQVQYSAPTEDSEKVLTTHSKVPASMSRSLPIEGRAMLMLVLAAV